MIKLPKLLGIITVFVFTVTVLVAQDMNPEAAKFFNTGNDKLKAGDYQSAISNYDQALKIAPDYRIYYQKGIALKKSGKNQESIPVLKEAEKLNHSFHGIYNALGSSYYALNQMEDAIENFNKALEISKDLKSKNDIKKNIALSYLKLGNTQLSEGNMSKAIEFLQKAVENNNLDNAYLALARAHSENGDWDKTIAAAENALKYRNSIGKGGPYYYIGLGYRNKGDMNKAKENFNLAKADPQYKKIAEYELSLLK